MRLMNSCSILSSRRLALPASLAMTYVSSAPNIGIYIMDHVYKSYVSLCIYFMLKVRK